MQLDQLKRREFITLIGGAAAVWPLAARAQQPGGRVYRVGFLGGTSLAAAQGVVDAFRDDMRGRGYVEGRNLAIDYRRRRPPRSRRREVG
jgi:putative ABC transport system substrate-binding protein